MTRLLAQERMWDGRIPPTYSIVVDPQLILAAEPYSHRFSPRRKIDLGPVFTIGVQSPG